VSQSCATFIAAGIQNSLAGFGGHTLHEAVLLGALAFLWLKCSFGHS
jgi:hypothetical protein